MRSVLVPHRIRQQRWLVRAACASDALAARAALRAAWDDALLPAIERALDRACEAHAVATGDPDVVLLLPRLDVALRVEDMPALERDLPSLVEEALVARLATLLPLAAEAGGHGLADDGVVDLTGGGRGGARHAGGARRDADATRDGVAGTDRARSAAAGAEAAGAALLHYLSTGTLPWDAHPTPWDGGVDGVRATLRAACVRAAARVAAMLVACDAPEPALFRLLALLDAATADAIADALARLLPRDREETVRAALSLGVATLPADRAAGTVADASGAPSDRHARLGAAARMLGAACRVQASHRPLASTAAAAPSAAAARGAAASSRDATASPHRHDVADGPPVDASHDLPVPLAGLVILHPFLPAFLRAQGADSTSAADRPRAAALLHHAVTGRREVDEWELPLVKLLVGVAPDDPLPVCAGLVRDADVPEADALLAAVLGHWRALGRTSPTGLRAGFLDRSGLLGRVSGAWRLRVEPAAHDLLLATLPWALSLVMLPWMPAPLHVEWTPP